MAVVVIWRGTTRHRAMLTEAPSVEDMSLGRQCRQTVLNSGLLGRPVGRVLGVDEGLTWPRGTRQPWRELWCCPSADLLDSLNHQSWGALLLSLLSVCWGALLQTEGGAWLVYMGLWALTETP